MLALLQRLRRRCAVGYVSGGTLKKQEQQLGHGSASSVFSLFDFCFAENGLAAWRLGCRLPTTSFIEHVGEAEYKAFVNWVLRYIADLDIPIKRGTFLEFRHGNVNISPIGQGASHAESAEFEQYDREHGVRRIMIEAMTRQFAHLNLRYAVGGTICFDVFPEGWDKTYCLQHLKSEKDRSGVVYSEIHFFGDKTYPGGNDYELYMDGRTIGHTVAGPEDTAEQIRNLFAV